MVQRGQRQKGGDYKEGGRCPRIHNIVGQGFILASDAAPLVAFLASTIMATPARILVVGGRGLLLLLVIPRLGLGRLVRIQGRITCGRVRCGRKWCWRRGVPGCGDIVLVREELVGLEEGDTVPISGGDEAVASTVAIVSGAYHDDLEGEIQV